MHIRKILSFSPYPPTKGGGSNATLEIFKRLSKKNKILLITYQAPSKELNNVIVYHFDLKDETSILRGFKYIIKGIRLGIKEGKRYNPDLIYSKHLCSPSIIAYFVAKKLKKPLVVHTAGSDIQNINLLAKNYGLFRIPYIILIKFLTKKIIKNANIIITNSNKDLLQITKKEYIQKSFLIYNGVDTTRFKKNNKKRSEVRKKFGLSKQDVVCIYSGRVGEEKNLKDILNLGHELKNIKFMLVGPSTNELNKIGLLTKNIIVTGYVKNVEDYLNASDIFLLNSSGEGISNSMLEAMAVGLPVIVTPVGDHKLIIKNKKNGFLINDLKEMKIIIIKLSKNYLLRKKIGKNAQKTIINKFNWDNNVNEIIILFKSLISKKEKKI